MGTISGGALTASRGCRPKRSSPSLSSSAASASFTSSPSHWSYQCHYRGKMGLLLLYVFICVDLFAVSANGKWSTLIFNLYESTPHSRIILCVCGYIVHLICVCTANGLRNGSHLELWEGGGGTKRRTDTIYRFYVGNGFLCSYAVETRGFPRRSTSGPAAIDPHNPR